MADSYKSSRTSTPLVAMRHYAYLHGGDVIDIMEEQAFDWSEAEIDRVLLPYGPLMADVGTFCRQTRQTWRGAPGDPLEATPDPTYVTAPTTAMTAALSRRSFGLSEDKRRRMADALERELMGVGRC